MLSPVPSFPLALLALGMPTLVAQAQGPTLDPSFGIVSTVGGRVAATFPQIFDMVRQPDGKFVVVGDFTRINNVPALNVCRILADGRVDTTFRATGTNDVVRSVALQADGRILLGGAFDTVNGRRSIGMARLLTNGLLDTAFIPPFGASAFLNSYVNKVVVHPGIGAYVMDVLIPPGSATSAYYLARLQETTGALDTTFRPGFDPFLTKDALVRPDGRLVLAGWPRTIGGQQCNVWGALPNGALDPAFVPLPGTEDAYGLVPDPATGNIYALGAEASAALFGSPVRLLPNGARDATFSLVGAFVAGTPPGDIYSLAVQPNGRLLLGGDFTLPPNRDTGSWRLLPNGTRDLSYQAANGPNFPAYKVLVQPNGALVFAGTFNQAGGFVLNCLARMLDPNVLASSTPAPDEADGLATWPVPARDVLHLRLPTASGPNKWPCSTRWAAWCCAAPCPPGCKPWRCPWPGCHPACTCCAWLAPAACGCAAWPWSKH